MEEYINDVKHQHAIFGGKFEAVYRRLYCRKFLGLSNEKRRYKQIELEKLFSAAGHVFISSSYSLKEVQKVFISNNTAVEVLSGVYRLC